MPLSTVKGLRIVGVTLWLPLTLRGLVLESAWASWKVLTTFCSPNGHFQWLDRATVHKKVPALIPCERFLSTVLLLVVKVCIEPDLFSTFLTYVWFLSRVCFLVLSQVQNTF